MSENRRGDFFDSHSRFRRSAIYPIIYTQHRRTRCFSIITVFGDFKSLSSFDK